jgi:hypothetical protein
MPIGALPFTWQRTEQEEIMYLMILKSENKSEKMKKSPS